MQLIEVNDAGSVREFHKVPFIIYKNDRNWIPHLKQDIEKTFDKKKNKAFRGGSEIVRWVLKDDRGQLIGRVAAFVNKKYSAGFRQPTGGMGFFECTDNREAAFMLLDACRDWLAARGMKAMDGPVNFGEKSEFWGLLTENFEYPPTYQMNYNPPYYRSFFEAYGFRTFYEQLVFWRDLQRDADEIFVRKAEMLWKDPKFRASNVKGMTDEQLATYFLAVYNDAWGSHEGFKAMNYEMALKIMKAIKPVKDPEISFFCFYEDRPIAFYINLPELNQIFRHVHGNLNLWGKLKFLYHKWKGSSTTMYGLVFGVVKDFQGQGVEGAIIKFAGLTVIPKGKYKDTVLTWIGDFNIKMLKICKNLNSSLLRRLVTYRYMIDPEIPFERSPFIGGKAEDVERLLKELPPLDENMKKYYHKSRSS